MDDELVKEVESFPVFKSRYLSIRYCFNTLNNLTKCPILAIKLAFRDEQRRTE